MWSYNPDLLFSKYRPKCSKSIKKKKNKEKNINTVFNDFNCEKLYKLK